MFFQERIYENMLIVDRYNGLYNSYEGEVKELYKRSDYYDEYLITMVGINDSDIDTNILSILRLPKNFTLYPGQVISYN